MVFPIILLYNYKLIPVYILFLYLHEFIMKVVFKMDALSALDEFFLLDNDKNRANVITVVKTDKMYDYIRIR